jgi:hypothetical protein
MIASQTHALANICRHIIEKQGRLPADPSVFLQVVATEVEKQGRKWPNDYTINPIGELCDCDRKPFQITVSSDRVSVTSASSYTFYFAGLHGPPKAGPE